MTYEKKVTYDSAGVDYGQLDALKRFAQKAALETTDVLPNGISDVPGSRGESARVIDMGDHYLAVVEEGLGTKNLIADVVDPTGELSVYNGLAQDTVAMIVNDLITVGAKPILVNAHWGFGSSRFLEQYPQKGRDLARGWADACIEAGALYAAGETPVLEGVIYPDAVELSGSAVGIIKPKERLTLGEKITSDDRIIFVKSNGIHANGLTLVRKISEELPEKYSTKLSDGRTLGEAMLQPTHIYAKLQQAIFEKNVDIHYMVNMTGHGWRKIMRAVRDFTYRISNIPLPQEEFIFIQQQAHLSDAEMYETFNMGAGFVFFVDRNDASCIMHEAQTLGYHSWDGGVVEEGPKQVIIEPKNIIYHAESLNIR